MTAVIASYTTATTGGTASGDLTFTKPTGLGSGDLIVLLGASERNDTNVWEALTTEPDDYTQNADSNNPADIQCSVYYKECDGSENWPLTVEHSSGSDFAVGWALRITGHGGVDAVAAWSRAFNPPITLAAATTTVDDCLAIYFCGFDGGDASTFTIESGTGWSIEDDLQDPVSNAGGVTAQFGTKTVTSAGSTGTIELDTSPNDGMQGIILAIAPAAAPSANGKILMENGATDVALTPQMWNGSSWVTLKAEIQDGAGWKTTDA